LCTCVSHLHTHCVTPSPGNGGRLERIGEDWIMTFMLPEGRGPTLSVSDAFSEWSRSWQRLMQPEREGGIEADLLSMTADMQEAALRFWMTSWGMPVPADMVVSPADVTLCQTAAAPAEAAPTASATMQDDEVEAAPVRIAAQIMPFTRNAGMAGPAATPVPPAAQVPAPPVSEFPLPAAVAAVPEIDPAGDFDDASVTPRAPAQMAGPDGAPDDLLVIKGIGPKLGRLLNDLGVWHYRQIGAWTAPEIAWINAKMDFKGRVQRERWVRQARELAGKAGSPKAVTAH
jgi:predicted flap endonuclease-1-like 5' DNA nuclease